MPWGAVAGAVIGAYASNRSADKAADAQERGGNAAVAEQRRQYEQTRQDQMPWLDAGRSALTQMQSLNAGDMSSFFDSPDYAYTRDQSLQGLDRSASARGGLYGGGHLADVMKMAGGLASQNYGNYYGRLAGLAGVGQSASQTLAQAGANAANGISGLYQGMGNARASSYLTQGNNYAQLAGGLGNSFSNWYQRNQANNAGGTGWYLGNNPGNG